MAVDVQAPRRGFLRLSPDTSCTGRRASACCTAAKRVLDAMPPFLGGGDMIRTVTFEGSTWNDLPYKFEAGTPQHRGRRRPGTRRSISSARSASIGSRRTSRRSLARGDRPRSRRSTACGSSGRRGTRRACVSFVMDGIHPHDIGTIVDREGVAIRTGHHCAQPVMDRFGIPATARASFAMLQHDGRNRRARRAAVDRVRAMLG